MNDTDMMRARGYNVSGKICIFA